MPDISMCSDNKCSRKEECYRFTSIPHEFRQAYADFKEIEKEKGCEYFISNKNRGLKI
jgi:hypothetical protein